MPGIKTGQTKSSKSNVDTLMDKQNSDKLEKRIEALERQCQKLRQEADEFGLEKEKYRQIVEHAPTGIYEVDLQRSIFTRVNIAPSLLDCS